MSRYQIIIKPSISGCPEDLTCYFAVMQCNDVEQINFAMQYNVTMLSNSMQCCNTMQFNAMLQCNECNLIQCGKAMQFNAMLQCCNAMQWGNMQLNFEIFNAILQWAMQCCSVMVTDAIQGIWSPLFCLHNRIICLTNKKCRILKQKRWCLQVSVDIKTIYLRKSWRFNLFLCCNSMQCNAMQ